MKQMMAIVVCVVFLSSCGGSAGSRLDELEAKNNALTQRVKTLEEQLLAAEKRLIVHEQAMQTVHSRQRDIENYLNKLQVSRGR
ncbi:MAG TPA: hypothetical protein VNA04_02965 [Thermoanaerobaculia bacterium]|nr:hypothetical protein [Thermoanaerobaculia bacterium]